MAISTNRSIFNERNSPFFGIVVYHKGRLIGELDMYIFICASHGPYMYSGDETVGNLLSGSVFLVLSRQVNLIPNCDKYIRSVLSDSVPSVSEVNSTGIIEIAVVFSIKLSQSKRLMKSIGADKSKTNNCSAKLKIKFLLRCEETGLTTKKRYFLVNELVMLTYPSIIFSISSMPRSRGQRPAMRGSAEHASECTCDCLLLSD